MQLHVNDFAARQSIANAFPALTDISQGYNFGSYDEIAPYLEPSGSGISSLWARTIALKHNTNVLVGYPEQVDAPGTSRAGPKQFNSAILVNGEGETVANYRKTFLHTLDETWAREGEEFYGDHVPGLGTIAIGIGMSFGKRSADRPGYLSALLTQRQAEI